MGKWIIWRKISISISSLCLMLMEYFMETIEQTYQEQILIEYGETREKIFTHRLSTQKSIWRALITHPLFHWFSTSMSIANLWTLFSMVILLKKIMLLGHLKIQNYFLLYVVRRWNRYLICSLHLQFLNRRKIQQGWLCLKTLVYTLDNSFHGWRKDNGVINDYTPEILRKIGR